MQALAEEPRAQFDLDMIKAMVETCIHYCESYGVQECNFSALGWKVRLKKKEAS
jgi:lipopolysaccharide biosynthesis regulator YciM